MRRANILLYCQRAIGIPEFANLFGEGEVGLLLAVVNCAGRYPSSRSRGLNPGLLPNEPDEVHPNADRSGMGVVGIRSGATTNPYGSYTCRGPLVNGLTF